MSRIVVGENDRVGKWMSDRMECHFKDAQFIGLEREGNLIAGVCYDWFQGPLIHITFVAEGKNWLTREYLWFCCYYPFEQLKATTIIGFVDETNSKSVKFTEHLGSRLLSSVDGFLIYGLSKDECKWLERKHVKTENPTRPRLRRSG